jgi:hypothetical protein
MLKVRFFWPRRWPTSTFATWAVARRAATWRPPSWNRSRILIMHLFACLIVVPAVLDHSLLLLPPYSTIVICSSSNLAPIVGTWHQFMFRLRDICVYYLPALLPLIVYPGEHGHHHGKDHLLNSQPQAKKRIYPPSDNRNEFVNFYTALNYTHTHAQMCSPDA